MQIRRLHGMRERLETRQLKVNGTLFRVHLSQTRGCTARLWAERYIPARSSWNGHHGGPFGSWVTIHDWR